MKKLVTLLCAVALLVSVSFAYAHEFILVPQEWQAYHAGQKLPFSLVSSHAFMHSEEMEAVGSVTASYNGMKLALHKNEPYQSLDGAVSLKKGAAAVLTAHRMGQIWSKTTQGWKQGDSSTLKGVLLTRMYEKFAKALLAVDDSTKGFDSNVGHALEIVPVDNPLTAKVGDEIRVKFLFNGKPFAPELVTATYKGFTDTENTYAYATEPYGEGIAKIRLSASGLWMVRIQHAVDVKGKKYQTHVMRATLTFPVAP